MMPATMRTGIRVANRPDSEGEESLCADPTFLSPVCTWRKVNDCQCRMMESMTDSLSRLDLVRKRQKGSRHVDSEAAGEPALPERVLQQMLQTPVGVELRGIENTCGKRKEDVKYSSE